MLTKNNYLNSIEEKSMNNDYDKQPSYIETVTNRIYFYSGIYSDKILQLNKQLRELDNSNLIYKVNNSDNFMRDIYLHINSYGGCIFDGLSGMDNLLMCKSKVITVVDGICASAGTLLSVAGKHRQITKNSFMLIHQLSSMFWGTYKNFKDEQENLDLLMKTIKDVYRNYTKIPEKTLNEILDRDLYLDAKKCLQWKLVDEII